MEDKGLGQRESALNTAKDLESTRGDFLAFCCLPLLSWCLPGSSAQPPRVDREKEVVSEVKTTVYNRAWNPL